MGKSDYYIQDNADIKTQKTNAAMSLYQSGDYKGALRLYLDMQNTDASSELYYEIGRCYYKLNDFDNAELYFTNSVSMDSVKNKSFIYLGSIFYKKQDLTNAIENWITSYSYKPDNENVCLNLASAYYSKNMRFYARFYYEKYLKYAKDKASEQYKEIKNTIDEFDKIGGDFYKNALKAIDANDNSTAIKSLEYAVKNIPNNFDINHILSKLYMNEGNFHEAEKYLLQAYCVDSKSIDILQKLAQVKLNIGDYTGAFCSLKRIMPLVINNQKIYLDTAKTIQQLSSRFKEFGIKASRENFAEKFYKDNHYYLALFEYENCVILEPESMEDLTAQIDKIRSFINPESEIIKLCFEKGNVLHSVGNYREANKYFSKIIKLANESTAEYKMAKSRIINV